MFGNLFCGKIKLGDKQKIKLSKKYMKKSTKFFVIFVTALGLPLFWILAISPQEQAEMMRAEIEAQMRGQAEARQIQAQMQEITEKIKAMQIKIEQECKKDPNNCSCEQIPCDEILQAGDNPQVQKGYQLCLQEKAKCEKQKQEAILKMQEQKTAIEQSCKKDISKCDCSAIENEDGKKQCELAMIEAKYQAEKQKTDKINSCVNDIEKCNCADIENETGKKECEQKLQEGKALKEKVKKACKENPVNCDCSLIENSVGKEQCEAGIKKGLEEASGIIQSALSKCFKNVETCDCANLGIPKPEYVEFCQIQKTYGLNCKHEGTNCDKLENVEIYPAGMPPWLGQFFAKSYSGYINKEKEKGAKEAAGIITQCLNSPENCDCSKTPGYARAFCEKKKALQIKCEAGDYDACLVLENEPNLPEGIPPFAVGMLEKMVNSLKNARKQLTMATASRKVGNMILECMDNASKCDCSLAPSGAIKTFCLHKKDLVGQCREQKIYESCFKLDEESNYPPQTPDSIKSYIDKNVIPKINEKKQKIFDLMKQGTVCEKIATLQECKPVYLESKK